MRRMLRTCDRSAQLPLSAGTMVASGTLFTYPENFRAYKALIAAKYSGAKVTVDPNFRFGETNKSDAFLKKFPLGKVPAFESEDGLKLWDGNTIAYYVANEALRGADAAAATQVQQFVNFAENEILPAACTWVFPCLGIIQYNKQNTERAKEDIKRVLSILNAHLETRTFLVGERVSLADIVVVCNLLLCYQNVLDAEFRKPYLNTNRWFLTCINQPEFKAVLGTFKLCEKMAQFDSKKYQELHGSQKKEQPKKDKKQDKPKQEQKAKPAEKKPEPAADEPPVEKKPKDPFANMPAGTFVMDDWKKTYSNEDTNTVAIPYFWENFDKEHYSIWYCEYKFPEDLKLVFMSCNLIGGMFQRLDRMRKHAFGNVLLFGENNKSTISGVWIWKGHDLAFELSEDLQIDYASYSWKKLDPNSEETKKMVNEYWAWEGDFGGKSLNQGKTFK